MKRSWYMALGIAGAVLAVLVVISALQTAVGPAPEGSVERRTYARTEDEKVVKVYILERFTAAKNIEFIEWGPHDISMSLGLTGPRTQPGPQGKDTAKQETAKQPERPSGPPAKVIRVLYILQNRIGTRRKVDELFFIRDGKVIGHEDNLVHGAKWKEVILDERARE